MKLPMRFRIIHVVSQHDNISDKEVMEALRDEYGDEGQYRKSIIDYSPDVSQGSRDY